MANKYDMIEPSGQSRICGARADTNRRELAHEAAGLLAVSVGFGRFYKEDTAQLEAGMALDDPLYRRARDGHNADDGWPALRAS